MTPTTREIPLDQIVEPRIADRVDIDNDGIVELAMSIKARGMINPLLVRALGSMYEIIAGNRRYLALKWLGRTVAECKVTTAEDAETADLRFVENIQRSDLRPNEEALAVRRMRDVHGKTVPEIAKACGKSEGWVRLRLQVLDWPEDIIARIAEGKLALAVAGHLAAIDDPIERYRLTQIAIDNGASAYVVQSWRAGWEATRTYVDTTAPTPAHAAPGQAPCLPMFPCWGCDQPTDLLKLQHMRFCPDCVLLLAAAKHAPAQAHEHVAG